MSKILLNINNKLQCTFLKGKKRKEKKRRKKKNTHLSIIYWFTGTNIVWLWVKMAKYHLFWKFLAKTYCFGNKWQTTTFSRTRVSETRVPHQFCHCGTVELEFVLLKKIHNTRVYQARVPFINKMQKILFLRYSSLPNSSTV